MVVCVGKSQSGKPSTRRRGTAFVGVDLVVEVWVCVAKLQCVFVSIRSFVSMCLIATGLERREMAVSVQVTRALDRDPRRCGVRRGEGRAAPRCGVSGLRRAGHDAYHHPAW